MGRTGQDVTFFVEESLTNLPEPGSNWKNHWSDKFPLSGARLGRGKLNDRDPKIYISRRDLMCFIRKSSIDRSGRKCVF